MSLTAYPPNPAADGTALIVFSGAPNTAVAWLLEGPGTLEAQSETTDSRGVAGAIFTPASEGDTVTVSVAHA